MTGFHPQTSVTASLQEVSWGLIKKQKAAFVYCSSLGPACLKITINRQESWQEDLWQIYKQILLFLLHKADVCEGERGRASTAVGSFVCSVVRRGCTVWRKQKKVHLCSVEGWQHLRDLEHNTCAQAPKNISLIHSLSVFLSLSLSLLLDKLWQKKKILSVYSEETKVDRFVS